MKYFAHIQQLYRDNAIEKELRKTRSSYTVALIDQNEVHETKGSVSDLVFHDIDSEWNRHIYKRMVMIDAAETEPNF